MAGTYPSINDDYVNLLKKICTNTADLSNAEAGDVASVAGTSGQVLVNGGTAAATGAVVLSLPTAITGVNSVTSATGQGLTLAALDGNNNITLTPSGTGFVAANSLSLSAANGGSVNTANRFALDEFAGAARMFSYGPNGATIGTFKLTGKRSDGTGDVVVLQSGLTGNLLLGGLTTDGALGSVLQIPSTATAGMAVYSTADVTTNYEALQINFSSGTFNILSAVGGSGSYRPIAIGNPSAGEFTIRAAASTSGQYDFFGNTNAQANAIYVRMGNTTSTATSGTNVGLALLPAYNQASGTAANTDLLINRTQTAVGSGAQNFLDLQIAGVSKLLIDNAGNYVTTGTGAFYQNTTNAGLLLNGNITGGTNAAITLQNQSTYNGSSGTQFGTKILSTINQTSTAAFTDLLISRTQTAAGSGGQYLLDAQVASTSQFRLVNNGRLDRYSGITLAGWGVPAIYSAGRVTAQSAANASIATYTVGSSDGSFRVSANMNVTASTTLVTTLTCTYTDESNTARTMIFPVASLAGSFIASGAITGAGASVWETPAMHIRCKASTVITILTSAGTFTGVTYTAEGNIQQIA